MDYEPYQSLLREKIAHTLHRWYDMPTVSYDEIYRFLHMIKGTAPTIQLTMLGEMARVKMDELEREQPDHLERDEWMRHLAFLYEDGQQNGSIEEG